MKNFLWFCLGVLTQRAMGYGWHAFYIAVILLLWWTRAAPVLQIVGPR